MTAAAETADGRGSARRGGRPARLLLVALLLVAALLRAWFLPEAARLADEGLAAANLNAAVAGEPPDLRIPPLSWAPQRLLLGLADRLYRATGWEALHAYTARGFVTRTGIQLARAPSVLYGVAGLLLLFLVARRLHSDGVALLAVLILAFSPWHIHASASFSPDILVLTLSTLALWLAMRALDRPAPAAFGLVGLALGAAAAAKVTGALAALPVLLALVLGGRGRGRLLPLAVAVPVAALTWRLLTPAPGDYLTALGLERAMQTGRAARELSSRFTVAVFALLHPLREAVHGRLLGALALVGVAGQAFRCLFLADPGPARVHRLMVVSAMPLFALGYAWASPLYQASSFVPLLAYSSLYAAVMLGILWETLGELVPPLRRTPWAAATAAALVVLLVVPTGWSYVHRSAVRSTAEVAVEWMRRGLEGDAPRLVLIEEEALSHGGATVMEMAGGLGLEVVPRLAGIDSGRLERADGAIFAARRLDGPEAAYYRDRRRATNRRHAVEGRLLRRRGPDLVALLRPYGDGPPREVELRLEEAGDMRRGSLPPAPDGPATVSLVVRLPPTPERAPAPPRVWMGRHEIEMAPGGFFPRHSVFVSERLPARPADRRLAIEPPGWMAAYRGRVTAAAYFWGAAMEAAAGQP